MNTLAAGFPWTTNAGYRSAALPAFSSANPGFTLLPPSDTGLSFSNILSDAKAAENQIRLNGSGVACGDVDGDGWCDVYLCGLENENKLYRNRGGWKFEDITAAAGVGCGGQFSSGAVFADVDGDGTLDLLVNGIGVGTRLFLNDGKGHFREVPGGLVHKYASTTATLADIDGDGYLDLYVANYRTTTIRSTGLELLSINGQLALKPEDRNDYQITPQGMILEFGEPHVLYHNDGHGNFQPFAWTNGTFLDEDGRPLAKAPQDWGLTAAFRDLNGDRAPDLYVCGDFDSPDRIWINNGRGQFRAIERTALRNSSTFSMAVDFADINRDGFDDFTVMDMLDLKHERRIVQFAAMDPASAAPMGVLDRPQLNRNVVQLNRGDATFAEVAYYCGLEASGWTWSSIFLDVDLDGYEDLLMSTGHQFDTQDLDAAEKIRALGPLGKEKFPSKILMYPRLPLPRLAFRNLGNLRFEECGARWGFNDIGVAHGMALADLDNDGDLDVVMNSLNSAVRVYRNNATAPRLAVRLKGLPANTRGIGARILVRGGSVPLQSQEMMCGGRYLGGDDNLRVFAAGAPTNRLSVEVQWRSGRDSFLTGIAANSIIEVDEAAATKPHAVAPSAPSPYFENVSQLLAHVHVDEPFDDFQRQPLLPKRLSQLGPGLAWADLDGDGWDDLVIGAGKGGKLAAFKYDGRGKFIPFFGPPFARLVPRDQTGILAWPQTNGQALILAAFANYEDESKAPNVVAFGPVSGAIREVTQGADWSAGPLAMGDLRGSGGLDLFVGGRVIPGRYPEPPSSRVYHVEGSRLAVDSQNSRVLENVGLVSGAVMTDLDGDGFSELVLACEWGPIRIFHNNHGRLVASDFPLKFTPGDTLNPPTAALSQMAGFWNGIAAGDLDGDGRMDLVAANWGLNTQYRASVQHPRRIYYGDFAQAGAIDTIEAAFDPDLNKEVPERELDAMAAAMPFLRGVFPTHHAYARAGIAEVLGDRFQQARVVAANTLASMAFLNRGDHFLAVPLPLEAQFSPAFAVIVADFDGDGAQDLFLSQNFFDVQIQASRVDAGRGLWLKGDGKGGFSAVPGQESGIKLYGEQRGAAVADYDGDGRIDLAVAQNSASTVLYHNLRAKPGLRVRLVGPAGNPAGFGAQLRLRCGSSLGASQEIQAGSGYWSQNSPVLVLASSQPPTELSVRWPGGKSTSTPLRPGLRAITVNAEGQIVTSE